MGKSGNPAKRAEQDTEQTYAPTPVGADGVEDFDAYWSEVDRPGIPVRIAGEVLTLPPAMPLQAELLVKRLERRSDEKATRKLLTVLYGKDRLNRWAEGTATVKGMDGHQLQVLLAWTIQRINGGTMSLAEVDAKITEAEAGGESGEA